jgi:hypothetical protein
MRLCFKDFYLLVQQRIISLGFSRRLGQPS